MLEPEPDSPSSVHRLLPTLRSPLDSVENQEETLDSLHHPHKHGKAELGIEKLVAQMKSMVVVVSSTWIVIVENTDFDADKVVDMVKMNF